jgi:hypothetical protein
VAALAVVLAACGTSTGNSSGDTLASLEGSGTDSTATVDTQVEAEEAAIAFAQCMRNNGIEIDDPTVDEDGSVDFFGGGAPPTDLDPQSEQFQTALDECGDLIEGAALGVAGFDDPEIQDQALALTTCLREQGIDVPDIDFSGGVPAGPPPGVDFDDPEFQAAFELCQEETGFAGPGGGR